MELLRSLGIRILPEEKKVSQYLGERGTRVLPSSETPRGHVTHTEAAIFCLLRMVQQSRNFTHFAIKQY